MKKILSVLIAAICLTACAFSFTACGDKTPEHTTHNWSTTYTPDEMLIDGVLVEVSDRHYQTCDGCDEKKYSNHDYGTSGVCVCGKHKPETPVTGVTLNKNTLTLEIGGTTTLTATVAPENATDKTVTWESDKTNIATVDKNGKVTAIKDGTAIITAKTANGKTATCTVTVNAAVIPVESVTLNKTAITLEIDETQTLTATLTPDNATDKTVTWTVAPAGVVSVDDNGNVTAIKDGTATVTATANGKSANCTVTVNAPLTNADVLKFLNDNVLMEAAKHFAENYVFTSNFNEDNVKNATWYVTKDGDNVTGANLVFNYTERTRAEYTTLYKVDFTSPLTPKNIQDKEVGTPTFTKVYINNFDRTIQSEHAQLADAIGDKLFDAKDGATRYIIDHMTHDLDDQFGTASRFTVIEVTDIGIREQRIHIAYANTDEGLISNLGDSSKFYLSGEEKSIDITGTLLEDNAEPFFGKVTPLGDKVTGEQLKTVFNAGYREKAIEYQLGKTYTGNIYDEAWYVTKSEKTGNIISSTFAFYYKEGTQTRFYKYTFIFRLRPFTYDDYLNAMNGDYADIAVDSENTTHYTIEDTAPKNTEHSALVNAVMNKFRNEWNLTSNAVAEFKSLSYKAWTTINGVDVEVRTLTMTIYDGDTWVDVKLKIKYASNDSEYITNLNNNLYKPFDNRYGSSKKSYSHSAWVEQVTTVNGEKL